MEKIYRKVKLGYVVGQLGHNMDIEVWIRDSKTISKYKKILEIVFKDDLIE